MSKIRDIPIPRLVLSDCLVLSYTHLQKKIRTEYKGDEIEFVLENLDVSSFNILPSHIYIGNITDVDIQTSASPSTPSRTSIGALTHIHIQALQLALKDVSLWYP